MKCLLCFSETEFYFADKKRKYVECKGCKSVIVMPEFFISFEEERERYNFHKNDTENAGYLSYIEPLVRETKRNFLIEHIGLDFGSGPNSGVSFLLRNEGYTVENYDPHFDDDKSKLQKKYDFVIACEVIEHFKEPAKEFLTLSELIKPNGKLLLMTRILTKKIEFASWFYKNDSTHVFFYSVEAFVRIAELHNFNLEKIEDRLIVLQKKA